MTTNDPNVDNASYEASSINPYQYWAQVTRIVDGDTMDFEVSLGFGITISKRARLLGVDTPEVWGVKKSSDEYQRGQEASNFVKEIMPEGKWVELIVHKGKVREKYGRFLCEVFVDGLSLNEALVNKGWGATY